MYTQDGFFQYGVIVGAFFVRPLGSAVIMHSDENVGMDSHKTGKMLLLFLKPLVSTVF